MTAVGGASSVNDANGNTLSGGGRSMTWDSRNRMVSCAYSGNTLTFGYGSDGLRRSETLTSGGQSVTTYYVYDGQSLVMEETKKRTYGAKSRHKESMPRSSPWISGLRIVP